VNSIALCHSHLTLSLLLLQLATSYHRHRVQWLVSLRDRWNRGNGNEGKIILSVACKAWEMCRALGP